jgi:hypothetical protein
VAACGQLSLLAMSSQPASAKRFWGHDMSMSGTFGKIVGNKLTDPLQLWKKHPDIVDPLNFTDAQEVKAQKQYDRQYKRVITRSESLQKDINKKYGLQGNLTILGG